MGNGYGNGGYGGNGALVIPVSYGNGYYSGGYGRSLVNNRDASESDEKDGDIPEDVLAAQKMVDEGYDDYTAKATATGLTPVPKDQLMEAIGVKTFGGSYGGYSHGGYGNYGGHGGYGSYGD